jgi:4-amino-4-deoxychorismate lyase
MTGTVLINGEQIDCLPTSDRGLLYGDGVFETLAIIDGNVRHWSRHMKRLQSGCERLGIEPVDIDLLESECKSLIEQADRAVLKIIVTRGSGGRGYRVDGESIPTRIVQVHDWPDFSPDYAAGGVAVRVCKTRMGHNPALAGIKHLNRLEQILARQEWNDPHIMEGLLLDSNDHIIEGTMSNIFMVKASVLKTPDLQFCGVAGITRAIILELASQQSIKMQIDQIELDELLQADELFLCNSLIGLWPVISLESNTFRKGRLTSRLQTLLDNTHPDNNDDGHG